MTEQWRIIDGITLSAPPFSGFGDYDLESLLNDPEQLLGILNALSDKIDDLKEEMREDYS